MAKIFPSFDIINRQSVPPTKGERCLLNFLVSNLDQNYEIYSQPYLNGDNPDIVIIRQNVGILIIEVKDWELDQYYIDQGGRWILRQNEATLKSPLDQLNRYRWNMIQLHIDTLLEKTIKNSKHFSLISEALFFSKNPEKEVRNFFKESYSKKKLQYLEFLGEDSLTNERLKCLIKNTRLDKESCYFTEELYSNLKRYLKPPIHQIEDGIEINYTKAQKLLIESRHKGRQKIKGIAGSGKTLVLAKRAVNAHIQSKSKVLVLTYNLSLKNYIHDKINEVREKFAWDVFEIINYHQFFIAQANNYNLPINSLGEWQNVDFFESVKNKIRKYDTT